MSQLPPANTMHKHGMLSCFTRVQFFCIPDWGSPTDSLARILQAEY